jgi:ribose/xylose/arabinose/galactoside ABC-type transport system permease subunit
MQQADLNPVLALRTLRVVWFAMLSSVASYVLIGLVFGKAIGPLEPTLVDVLRVPLLIAALAAALLALFLSRTALQPTPLASAAAATSTPYQSVLGPHFLTYAVAEAPALFGLVLYFLFGAVADLLALGALGLLALALAFPGQGHWNAIVAELQRQRPNPTTRPGP